MPPPACTVIMLAPSAAAECMAPVTVLGMSWNFRSRKTLCPRFSSGSSTAGPVATNSSRPTLNHWHVSSNRSTREMAEAMSGTSSATISRLRASASGLVPGRSALAVADLVRSGMVILSMLKHPGTPWKQIALRPVRLPVPASSAALAPGHEPAENGRDSRSGPPQSPSVAGDTATHPA